MTSEDYAAFAKNYGMRPEFELCTVKNAIIDKANQKIYSEIIEWPTNGGRGLFIFGKTGTGKSLALKIKANILFEDKVFCIKNRILNDKYLQWIELQSYLDNTIRNNSFDTTNNDRVARIENETEDAEWLFIDDFGATTNTPTQVARIFKLIDARSHNRKQTFISSNLSLSEIKDYYGERIHSRLCGMCDFRKLEGPDRRTMR